MRVFAESSSSLNIGFARLVETMREVKTVASHELVVCTDSSLKCHALLLGRRIPRCRRLGQSVSSTATSQENGSQLQHAYRYVIWLVPPWSVLGCFAGPRWCRLPDSLKWALR